MMELNGYPDLLDRKTHDRTRDFCAVEGLDEDHFRYCVARRIRQARRTGGTLPRVRWALRLAGMRLDIGVRSLLGSLAGALARPARNRHPDGKKAAVSAGIQPGSKK